LVIEKEYIYGYFFQIYMFYLFVGIFMGIWLDQTFTFPPIQDYFTVLGNQYKKHIDGKET